MPTPALTAQKALDLALAAVPAAAVRSLALPGARSGTWTAQLDAPDDTLRTVAIDDASGQTDVQEQPRGDARVAWLRRVHEGRHHGPVWRAIVLCCGLSPTVLAVTGLLIWLRKRRNKRAMSRMPQAIAVEPYLKPVPR